MLEREAKVKTSALGVFVWLRMGRRGLGQTKGLGREGGVGSVKKEGDGNKRER